VGSRVFAEAADVPASYTLGMGLRGRRPGAESPARVAARGRADFRLRAEELARDLCGPVARFEPGPGLSASTPASAKCRMRGFVPVQRGHGRPDREPQCSCGAMIIVRAYWGGGCAGGSPGPCPAARRYPLCRVPRAVDHSCCEGDPPEAASACGSAGLLMASLLRRSA
jgi:hypothetical protein